MTRIRSTSHWDNAGIAMFLGETQVPVRLAVNDGGTPLICSLWFLYDDAAIWCATQRSAHVAALLAADPRVGFEVAPETMPYRGVRGQGRVTLLPDQGPALLARLVDRYLGTRETGFARWLLTMSVNEVAIRIDPDWLTAWDFSARMSR